MEMSGIVSLMCVQVYSSSQTTASRLAVEISGTVSPLPVRSTTSAYVVQFSSDATVQRSGWSAAISFGETPDTLFNSRWFYTLTYKIKGGNKEGKTTRNNERNKQAGKQVNK